jgi:hypothetical protein
MSRKLLAENFHPQQLNFIMHDARAYGCSSHTNGGKHLCANDLRVRREIAEGAVPSNVQNGLLSDDMLRYVEQRVRVAPADREKQTKSDTTSISHPENGALRS